MIIAYIKPNEDILHVIRMRDSLERWYELLECRCIEIHKLDQMSDVDFICDEEGKLVENPQANFYWPWGRDILTGIVAFAHDNINDSDMGDLTEEDIDHIVRFLNDYAVINDHRRQSDGIKLQVHSMDHNWVKWSEIQ